MPAEGDATAVAADQPASATALNGAQVTAAKEIVRDVAIGALPRDTGVSMLVEFFNLDVERANRIMGSVGRGFSPADDSGEPLAKRLHAHADDFTLLGDTVGASMLRQAATSIAKRIR